MEPILGKFRPVCWLRWMLIIVLLAIRNEENILTKPTKSLQKKIDQAIEHEFITIFCCGELLSERQAGKHFDVVREQIEKAVFPLSEKEFYNIVIAYEPVWAIGTGVNATPEQAQEMHAYIRNLIASRYGKDVADETSILYGGSCNSKNAPEIFAQPDVDGGLIGGASLNADEFIEIVKAIL